MESDFEIHPLFEAFYIETMLWHTNSALDAVKVVGDWIELVVADDTIKRVKALYSTFPPPR